MPVHPTRREFVASAAAAAAFASGSAFADTYPSHPIRLIVPYSPGGGGDIMARILAPAMGKILKQTVVVENKPGASAIIGTELVSHAAPDGYTLLLTQNDPVINAAVYQNLPYDTLGSLTPISKLATFPFYLAVKVSSPFKTVEDLVTFARAHPEKANFASTGAVFWLVCELFAQKTGLNLTRVTYRGGGAMVLAVISGEVLFTFAGAAPITGAASAGTIRLLASTASRREAAFPNVPTFAEVGIPGMTILSWSSLWAPAKLPAAILDTVSKAARQAVAMPDVVAEMKRVRVDPDGSTPEQFKRSFAAELAMWKDVAKKAGISAKL
ncbi:MAG: tripartite tricarboxylate transporter substrate-binding protein [Xanthobacteraceae bacterium]